MSLKESYIRHTEKLANTKPSNLCCYMLLLVLMLHTPAAIAQDSIPRDTSFTTYSAYTKELKNYPFIRIAEPALPAGVLVKTNVVYSSVNSKNLHADVFYPAKKRRKGYPGVVLIHGGGWRSGDKSQTIPMAQQLAAKGYVAVAVEYRLSPEAIYPAGLLDVKTAIRWMRKNAKQFKLNPKRIAVLGMSSGGQMAALLGSTNGYKSFEERGEYKNQLSDVQAAIDIDGILAFKHPESAEGAVAAAWLGGDYAQQPERWNEASALSHAGPGSVPVLFINSSLPRFHAGRDDMIKKLDSAGIYHEVHTLPDTPHPFWLFHPWFTPTVEITTKFLDRIFK